MAQEFARMAQIIGSDADWSANDLVLFEGEIAFELLNTYTYVKVGDGVQTFSQLPYAFGGPPSVPLVGTIGYSDPITGILEFENTTVNKAWNFGIFEFPGVDDMILTTTGGNTANANFWLQVNANQWVFRNDGKLLIPDVTFGAGDELYAVNKQYVDNTVAGGVSSTFIPLVGTSGNPVTGIIQFESAALGTQYSVGIDDVFGTDSFIITGTGANADIAPIWFQANGYDYVCQVDGRLTGPDITYGVGDDLAYANKKYVDSVVNGAVISRGWVSITGTILGGTGDFTVIKGTNGTYEIEFDNAATSQFEQNMVGNVFGVAASSSGAVIDVAPINTTRWLIQIVQPTTPITYTDHQFNFVRYA